MNMYSNSREEMTRHWETSLTEGLTEEEAKALVKEAEPKTPALFGGE